MSNYEKTNNFYVQKIHLTNISQWRFDFFSNLCQNKKVLHIGCADSMVFNPETNLHIYLAQKDGYIQLDGMDPDQDTLQQLNQICRGRYFNNYSDITEEYDLVLVPEVIEHVLDMKTILDNIFSIKSKEYLFTVPNILTAQIFCEDDYSLEMIHPDHKFWFSPYTLFNLMKPYAKDFDIKIYYLEGKSQIGMHFIKKTEQPIMKSSNIFIDFFELIKECFKNF